MVHGFPRTTTNRTKQHEQTVKYRSLTDISILHCSIATKFSTTTHHYVEKVPTVGKPNHKPRLHMFSYPRSLCSNHFTKIDSQLSWIKTNVPILQEKTSKTTPIQRPLPQDYCRWQHWYACVVHTRPRWKFLGVGSHTHPMATGGWRPNSKIADLCKN